MATPTGDKPKTQVSPILHLGGPPGGSVEFDHQSKFLFVNSFSRTQRPNGIWQWDLERNLGTSPHRVLPVRTNVGLKNLAVDPNRPLFYMMSIDGAIQSWDIRNNQLVGEIKDRGAFPSFQIALHPSGNLVSAETASERIGLFDTTSGQRILTLGSETAPVWAMEWEPSGYRLAVSLSDGGVSIWDVSQVVMDLQKAGFAPDVAFPEELVPVEDAHAPGS